MRRRIGRLRRWLNDRCVDYGHRFRWREARYSSPSLGVFHGPCESSRHWRTVAGERLDVLELVADVWEVKGDTVFELLSMRYPKGQEHNGWNLAWRVFYDLEQRQTRESVKGGTP